jgi:hypothetical protein
VKVTVDESLTHGAALELVPHVSDSKYLCEHKIDLTFMVRVDDE